MEGSFEIDYSLFLLMLRNEMMKNNSQLLSILQYCIDKYPDDSELNSLFIDYMKSSQNVQGMIQAHLDLLENKISNKE